MVKVDGSDSTIIWIHSGLYIEKKVILGKTLCVMHLFHTKFTGVKFLILEIKY